MRGQLGPAWEMVSRWERLQPVEHRTPVPELVTLAWCFGMRRWAAVTLISFYGLARVGEVLKVTRKDLLLPEDHMGGFLAAFARLAEKKTSSRGHPRVQHLRIDNEVAVQLIQLATRGLAAGISFFLSARRPTGAGGISSWSAGPTRKCLATWRPSWRRSRVGLPPRAPGKRHSVANEAQKSEHPGALYLQEVAALNSLLEAGPDSRARLKQVASLFGFLVHSS